MTKKAIKAEDIIDAIQDPKITEILMKNLTQLITPIVEIVVVKMSASLSEAFEKMVDQKISTNQETIIASCDTKLFQAQEIITKAYTEKITHLEDELARFTVRMDVLAVQSRAKSLIIHGLDEDSLRETAPKDADYGVWRSNQQQVLTHTVLELCRSRLNMGLGEIDISGIRRIAQKKDSKSRPVLVEFTSKLTRDKIYQSKKMLKPSDGHFGPQIFINENLIRHNANLFFCARKLLREKKTSAAWSMNGAVYMYIKMDPSLVSRPKRITKAERAPDMSTAGSRVTIAAL